MRRLFITIFILIVIVGIFIFSKHVSDVPRAVTKTATTTQPVIYLSSLSHSYHRGNYTISGAVIVPTPCYVVAAQTTLVPSTTPPVIKLDLSVPEDIGTCLQLQATSTFRVTQHAASHAVIRTYLNGTLATTTGSQ